MTRVRSVAFRCFLPPLLAVVLFVFGAPASSQTTLRAPPDLADRIGFDQHLGARVPLDGTFLRADGMAVRLADVVNGKPTLLVPGYYTCANLCGTVRTGIAHAVERSGLRPGRDFEVVLMSIDPHEAPTEASAAQHEETMQHPGAEVARWNYLSGAPAASAAVMRSIGFRSLFDPRNGQYDHDAGVVLLSPDGTIVQYLFGVAFEPETLRLGLVNASRGQIGNIVDHFLLLCCDYDASTGRYSLAIYRVMQGVGIATALALVGLVVFMLRNELRRRDGSLRP